MGLFITDMNAVQKQTLIIVQRQYSKAVKHVNYTIVLNSI